MPNWCQNRLYVTGPLKEVARFARENRGNEQRLTFQSLLPIPEPLMDRDSVKEGSDHMKEILGLAKPTCWRTWCIRMWGTKWDACEVKVERVADDVMYSFDTAWGPPTPWVLEASKRYPLLTFNLRYCETGNDFSGNVVCKRGRTVKLSEGKSTDVHPEEGFGNYF